MGNEYDEYPVFVYGDVCDVLYFITHFIWADNIWLLASDRASLEGMVKSWTDVFNSRTLFRKRTSLQRLSTSESAETSTPMVIPSMREDQTIVGMPVACVDQV